jgi:hypothetical protein
MERLRESIREHGILEPLVIYRDGELRSGHRRFGAGCDVGVEKYRCQQLSICRHQLSTEEHVQLLREYNLQRPKTIIETIREAAIDAETELEFTSLCPERVKRFSDNAGAFEIEGHKTYSEITDIKMPMLEAIELRRKFWPLTVRQVHYVILHIEGGVIRNSQKDTKYVNDANCYDDLCNLLLCARVQGLLSWDALRDETRPVRTWPVCDSVGEYVEKELSSLYGNYWRNSQKSQPDYFEFVVEKNASLSVIENVEKKYCIPQHPPAMHRHRLQSGQRLRCRARAARLPDPTCSAPHAHERFFPTIPNNFQPPRADYADYADYALLFKAWLTKSAN